MDMQQVSEEWIAVLGEDKEIQGQHIQDLVQIQAYADYQVALIPCTSSAREIEAK